MSGEAEFGITIAGEQERHFGMGEPVWIEATVLLPLANTERPEPGPSASDWHRSLYLTCITEEDQVPLSTNLWKDRLIFGDEFDRVSMGEREAVRIPLRFEVADELGSPLEAGRYYLHLSARQYQSRVVVIEVE